jgi:hypothetical protein
MSPLQESRLRPTGMTYYLIGKTTKQRRLRVLENGRPLKISNFGFDHFVDQSDKKREKK